MTDPILNRLESILESRLSWQKATARLDASRSRRKLSPLVTSRSERGLGAMKQFSVAPIVPTSGGTEPRNLTFAAVSFRTDGMADPKDLLAAERTLLAWIRTGVALMGLGFVVARFGLFLREVAHAGGYPRTHSLESAPVGLAVVLAGVALNVWASVRHHFMVRNFRAGKPEISAFGPVFVGVATGVGGLLLIALLAGALK